MISAAIFVNDFTNPTETFIYKDMLYWEHFQPTIFALHRKTNHFQELEAFCQSDLPPFKRGMNQLLAQGNKEFYFRALLKEKKVKLISAHFSHMAYMCTQYADLNVPMISSFYGGDLYKYIGNPFFAYQMKKINTHSKMLFTVSRQMKNDIHRIFNIPEDKVRVNYIGVEVPESVAPKPSSKINFVMIGRLFEKKGFKYGIAAFKEIYKRIPQSTLTIIGGGPLEQELKQCADGHPAIQFAGMLPYPKMLDALVTSHIMICPSISDASDGDREGLSMVLKEAMASRCVIIASKYEGFEEIIEHTKTGILVPEKDIQSIIDQSIMLAHNVSFRNQLADNAYTYIKKFHNRKTQAKKMEDFMLSLIR